MIGDQETVAVAMHVEAAGCDIRGWRRRNEVAGAQLDQLPLVAEAVQRRLQSVAVLALQPQFLHQLFIGWRAHAEAGECVRADSRRERLAGLRMCAWALFLYWRAWN